MNAKDITSWIGKSKTSHDTLGLDQARLLNATIRSADSQENQLKDGSPLPPLWHWIYFQEVSGIDELGRDGHSEKGGFLPPVDLPRRMWAGSRLTYEKHPAIGDKITRKSTIKDIASKDGKTGKLCFVTVLHEYENQKGQSLFTEEQDIVYREDPQDKSIDPPVVAPPESSIREETVTPSPVLLFRYSALTFNSHRIHYDRDYCTGVEGYPGLVFHGPLTATLLADLAIRQNPEKILRSFHFRATAPLFDTQEFAVKTDGKGTYWAETPKNGLAMKAQATFG